MYHVKPHFPITFSIPTMGILYLYTLLCGHSALHWHESIIFASSLLLFSLLPHCSHVRSWTRAETLALKSWKGAGLFGSYLHDQNNFIEIFKDRYWNGDPKYQKILVENLQTPEIMFNRSPTPFPPTKDHTSHFEDMALWSFWIWSRL